MKEASDRLEAIMSSPVVTFHEAVPASDALATMAEAGVRHGVVVRGREVIGVVTERDLRGEHRRQTVADRMQRAPIVASPDTTMVAAALFMRDHAIGCVPVVAKGMLVGIVTRGDLLGALAASRSRRRAS